MRYRHFSKDPDLRKKPLEIQISGSRMGAKPHRGFWFSDEDNYGWKAWCESEEFRLDSLAWEYPVSFAPGARVLTLKTPAEVEGLDEVWGREIPGLRGYFNLDYEGLADLWDVLIISPYQRSLWLSWYLGWDCASGVALRDGIVRLGKPKRNERSTA